MVSPRATLLAQGRSDSVACLTVLSKGTEYIPGGHAASYTPRQQNTSKGVGILGTCQLGPVAGAEQRLQHSMLTRVV